MSVSGSQKGKSHHTDRSFVHDAQKSLCCLYKLVIKLNKMVMNLSFKQEGNVISERVCDWMTANPIVVSPDTLLAEAAGLMQQHKIRKLPVQRDGKLVGIVTWGDIRKASASDVSQLAGYELDYLIDKIKIKRIMSAKPLTVTPDTSLAQAADIMLQHKVGGLPVLDGDQLVGIITESDILRALMSIGNRAA